MTAENQIPQNFHSHPIGKRALQGAGLAFALVVLFMTFLASVSENELSIRIGLIVPVLTVSIAGACGGIFYFMLDPFRSQGGWKKVSANIVSGLAYIIGLYLSLVIGLAIIGLWD